MSEDREFTSDGPLEGTAGPDIAQSCGNNNNPTNLYLAAKNLVEADGFMVLVYLLAILGKIILSLLEVCLFGYTKDIRGCIETAGK